MSASSGITGSPKAITASSLIKTGGGTLIRLFCSTAGATSRAACSDAITSAASAGAGRFVPPFAPVAGSNYTFEAGFGTGLYVSLSGSAATMCVVYAPAS